MYFFNVYKDKIDLVVDGNLSYKLTKAIIDNKKIDIK